MTASLKIPNHIWDEIIADVNKRLSIGKLEKPIVFALYTTEHDHQDVTGYREIPTVKITKGHYPDDYDYRYPGIKALGFYPKKGTGRWFSGTLVVGDGIDMDESDKQWIIKEQLYFRIKADKDQNGQLQRKAYCIDFPEVTIE